MLTKLTNAKKFMLLELMLYVVAGTLAALYVPGITNNERPLVFIVSGSILGFIIYANNIGIVFLRYKLGLLSAYTILSATYTIFFIFVNLADPFTEPSLLLIVGNSIMLGLLTPFVLLVLASPVIIAKKIYKKFKNKLKNTQNVEKKEKNKQYLGIKSKKK